MSRPTLRDRIAGGLLGVAAGDALGATVEFLTPQQIHDRHGLHQDIVGGGSFGWRPGQGTDDTDLTWAVTRAYLRGYSLDAIVQHMLDWYRTGPRDIGGTTATALRELASHGDPTRSGRTHDRSAGNGSLMRCLPTALARTEPTERRSEAAAISAITHAEPRTTDACVAYCDIAAALLDGAAPTDALTDVAHHPNRQPTVAEALTVAADTPIDALDTSGYVIASLTCAAWAIQQHTTLEDCLVQLVNRGNDADTTGAIVGGLLGVRDGIDAIPTRWTARLEYRDRLLAAVDSLSHLRLCRRRRIPRRSLTRTF